MQMVRICGKGVCVLSLTLLLLGLPFLEAFWVSFCVLVVNLFDDDFLIVCVCVFLCVCANNRLAIELRTILCSLPVRCT